MELDSLFWSSLFDSELHGGHRMSAHTLAVAGLERGELESRGLLGKVGDRRGGSASTPAGQPFPRNVMSRSVYSKGADYEVQLHIQVTE